MVKANNKIRVCIVYPADPMGAIPGGIDTCIKGLLRYAPQDICMSMVGVSSGESECKAGSWSNLYMGHNSFRFMPLLRIHDEGKQSRIPLSLKFCAALPAYLARQSETFDVVQFHRLEPAVFFAGSDAKKVAFIHQNMKVIYDANCDIRWKHLPAAYFAIERYLIPKMRGVYCVHREAAQSYRERFPEVAGDIHFLPSWVDPQIFYPGSSDEREVLRKQIREQLNVSETSKLIVYLGRLEAQKNPKLLINSFKEIAKRDRATHLLIIGDGSMRSGIEKQIRSHLLEQRVSFVGTVNIEKVSDYLRGSDVLILTSEYEGMPRCVNEALGCGLPVVTSRVGEVELVVRDGVNGIIVDDHNPAQFADAVLAVLSSSSGYTVKDCVESIQSYVPEKVLAPVYEAYRRMSVFGAG